MKKEEENPKKEKVRSGIPMSQEELKEQEQVWKDIEDSIDLLTDAMEGRR